MGVREKLAEVYDDDLLFADGFDSAIIGVGERCGAPYIVVYDREKAIKILVKRDKMSREEAVEYFDFNVTGAYVGEKPLCGSVV